MKKKTKIILAIAFVVVAIVFYTIGDGTGYASGYNAAVNAFNSEGTTSANNTSDKTNESSNNQKGAVVVPLKTAENLGNIELTVLNEREANNVANEAGKTNAAGKFVIVELQIKNLEKQAISYDPHQFALDAKGTMYTIDDNSFDALGNLNQQETIFNKNKDFIGAYDDFNPGIIKKTYLAFDVPKDFNVADAKLILDGNKNIEFNLK